MTTILDGKKIAQEILDNLKAQVDKLSAKKLRPPGLATVLVGDDPASHVYVRSKRKKANAVGIKSFENDLPSSTSEEKLLGIIEDLNQDPAVDGILVQLPLPNHINKSKVICAVSPAKDVDGFHPQNIGLLSLGKPAFVPCTPKACMRLIESAKFPLLGAHAVIVGRSNIVGKPLAYLMLKTDATVTICHKNTKDLQSHTKMADILISATGVPHLIKAKDIKEGAVVIDVGINRLADNTLVGDVDFEDVKAKTKAITPVPGGVGPMTIATLLENTLLAYQLNTGN